MSKNNYVQLYRKLVAAGGNAPPPWTSKDQALLLCKAAMFNEKQVQADHNVFQSCSWELQQPDASTLLLVAFSKEVPSPTIKFTLLVAGWFSPNHSASACLYQLEQKCHIKTRSGVCLCSAGSYGIHRVYGPGKNQLTPESYLFIHD